MGWVPVSCLKWRRIRVRIREKKNYLLNISEVIREGGALVTESYNLRTRHWLVIPNVHSVKYGYQTVSFRAAII